MFLLGYDIGSSSVKASLVDAETGKCVASAFFPKTEAGIIAIRPGWAEQEPESWWENLKLSTRSILSESRVDAKDIKAIGISYQMHGLVCVDKRQRTLRPAIIWCDSRAVSYGQRAFEAIGEVNVSLLRSFRKQRRASLPYVPDGQSKNRKVGGRT